MAGRQLGKLRQWAGEVIAQKRTTYTDEFRELEQDVELRRAGAARLVLASEGYYQNISKRKPNEALQDEKLLPLDTFGVVMCMHGEEFGGDSVYGTSLVSLGRAHCKAATLQDAFALNVQENFITSLKKFGEDIKEYEVQKKKLESRRLSYDSAVAKYDKIKGVPNKKEKEKREAEEDVERARQRFEEMEEDVRNQMHIIQEKEIAQQKELTSLLDNELTFIEKYYEILQEVKAGWAGSAGKRPTEEPPKSRRPEADRQGSIRSKRSTRTAVESDEEEEEVSRPAISRSRSLNRTTDSAPNSRPSSRPPSSRPSSRLSRKRTTSMTAPSDVEDKDKDKEKKEKPEKAKRLSMAGWASTAMGSMITKKSKDKDRFTTLQDQENEDRDQGDESRASTLTRSSGAGIISHIRNKSRDSIVASPKPSSRILKPLSLQDNTKKIVRAVYDFDGAADELSFKVGDEILVLNEVLDGWWMGELDGKKGLFPTAYVDVLPSKPSSTPKKGREESPLKGDYEDDSDAGGGYGTSDLDDDRDLSAPPVTPRHSPFYGGPPDTVSIASDQVDEEQVLHHSISGRKAEAGNSSPTILKKVPMPIVPVQSASPTASPTPPFVKRATTTDGTTSKKAPPPPPPPRRASNAGTLLAQGAIALPAPDKRHSMGTTVTRSTSSASGTSSSGSVLLTPGSIGRNGGSSPVSSAEYDTSPFESESDSLHTPVSTISAGPKAAAAKVAAMGASLKGCTDFRQNPFKAHGFCNNCFEVHV